MNKTKIKKDKMDIKNDIECNASNDLYSIIQTKTEYIQEIVRKTVISIEKNKKNEIFSNNDIISCINYLHQLYQKSLDICIQKTTDENINILQHIVDKLAIIMSAFGTESIQDLLYIVFGIEYKKKTYDDDPIFAEKYKLITQYCHPIGYKINHNNQTSKKRNVKGRSPLVNSIDPDDNEINNTPDNSKEHQCIKPLKSSDLIQLYCNDKLTEDTLFINKSVDLECYDMCYIINTTFQVKIYGIQIIIQNKSLNKTLIISCITEDIDLDLLKNNLYIKNQQNEITQYFHNHVIENNEKKHELKQDEMQINNEKKVEKRELSQMTQPTIFHKRIEKIIHNMTLKDILVYGKKDIYKRFVKIEKDVQSIIHNKLDTNIKHFLEMDLYLQRERLIHLLLYDMNEDVQYISYILYDIISLNSNQNIFERSRFGEI